MDKLQKPYNSEKESAFFIMYVKVTLCHNPEDVARSVFVIRLRYMGYVFVVELLCSSSSLMLASRCGASGSIPGGLQMSFLADEVALEQVFKVSSAIPCQSSHHRSILVSFLP
jgi:hypothetical protein